MVYGGARYIGTGRGFAITANSFIRVYTNYARSHLYFGFELAVLAIVLAIAQDCVVSFQSFCPDMPRLGCAAAAVASWCRRLGGRPLFPTLTCDGLCF